MDRTNSQVNICKKSLEAKGYEVQILTEEAAVSYLQNTLKGKKIGFGDSQTLARLHLREVLSNENVVIDPSTAENFDQVAKESLQSDIYLSSVNALSETGEMINLDGAGNRIAGTLFGHEKVYFIVDTQKICKDLHSALEHVRQVEAPQNAKRLHKKTPCADKGDRCYDCNCPDRICNGLMIYLHKMSRMPMEVILLTNKEEVL